MADLGPGAWPPAPINTERLVLREPRAQDRAAVIELFASPEVGTYLGGSRPRDELERAVPEVPMGHPGLFVVDLDRAMIDARVHRGGALRGIRCRAVVRRLAIGHAIRLSSRAQALDDHPAA
jgi:hypothetical protein